MVTYTLDVLQKIAYVGWNNMKAHPGFLVASVLTLSVAMLMFPLKPVTGLFYLLAAFLILKLGQAVS